MKKNSLRYFIPVAALFLLYACAKNDGITNQSYSAYGITSTQGQLKVNVAVAYTADPANIFVKLNGNVVSNAMQGRTPFPGGGLNTRGQAYSLFLSAPIGSNTVSLVMLKAGTTTDSVVLYTTTVNIPDNSPYTLHVTDTLVNATTNNTKSVLVKSIISNSDTGRTVFKFVNLIPNVPSVDLYLNGVLIKSGLAYLTPSDTFSVRTGVNQPGYVPGNVATFAIRTAGAAATVTPIASYATNTALTPQLVFTIFSLGYSGSTGTRLPFLSFQYDKNQ